MDIKSSCNILFLDIINTELKSSVSENTDVSNSITFVDGSNSVSFNTLFKTIHDSAVHFLSSLFVFCLSRKLSSYIIKWISYWIRCHTSKSTSCDTTYCELKFVFLLIKVTSEIELVFILKCEVKGLRWHVSDNVWEVSIPESLHSFFF